MPKKQQINPGNKTINAPAQLLQLRYQTDILIKNEVPRGIGAFTYG